MYLFSRHIPGKQDFHDRLQVNMNLSPKYITILVQNI
jgi:hypothetical protein